MNNKIILIALSLLTTSLVTLPAVSQTVTPLVRPSLRVGSEGTAVSELQAALKLLGYYNGDVDGKYAESTVIAVSRFQQAAGLDADGIVNNATWERLFPVNPPATANRAVIARNNIKPPANQASSNINRNNPSSPPILREGMRGEAVVRLQERLRALGLLKTRPDGIFGEATLAAVKAAQVRFNLQPDGVVGGATWRALLR